MGTTTDDTVLDALLDEIGNNCNQMFAVDVEPANRAAAIIAALITTAMSPADFSNADRAGGGRELTVVAKNGEDIDVSGTFNHVSYCSASLQQHVKVGTTQVLTSGGTANYPTTKIGVSDPTSV